MLQTHDHANASDAIPQVVLAESGPNSNSQLINLKELWVTSGVKVVAVWLFSD